MSKDGGAGLIREHQVLAGRYEIDEVLGRGGMAEVYRGTDRLLSRTVAVKVLPSWLASDPSYVSRFRREARAAAGLNHPNVVGVYDTGSDGDVHFIVMEHVVGRTLEEDLRGERRFPPERAVEVAAAVALALEVAHREGVVHRDVKPGNIMLADGGGVKVMDFGIARALSSQTLTQTGTVFGTATYLSPEQARGDPVDARSDLYSLGVVIYEMLTGRPPFEGETAMAVATKHLTETPIPPRQRAPEVSEGLEAVTLRAMARDPAERYQAAGDLREDLERVGRGERPLLGAAAGAAIGAASAGAAADASDESATAPIEPARTDVMPLAPAPSPPGAEPPPAPAGPPGRRWPVVPVVVGALLLLAVLFAVVLLGGDDRPGPAQGPSEPGQEATPSPPSEEEPGDTIDDPVALALLDLRDTLEQGVNAGGISAQAATRIATHAQMTFDAYESGDPDRAVRALDRTSAELDKAVDREEIDEDWAGVVGEKIQALGQALGASIPAEETGEGEEDEEAAEGNGNGGGNGKGKGKGKGKGEEKGKGRGHEEGG